MEHWFDRFTKQLVLNKVPRGSFLAGAAAAVGVAAVGLKPMSSSAAPQVPKSPGTLLGNRAL